MAYVIKILSNQEYDKLPYRFARQSLGCADPRTKTAYIRSTQSRLADLFTIGHEIDELVSKYSPHEVDGIRYKGKKQPEYTPPPAPVYPTAEELYAQATKFGQSNYPLAYGAREGALGDLSKGLDYYSQYGYKTPTEITPEFYQRFQPTSFEEALGDQYFQNVWPDTQAQIRQALSLSGMAYSPQLAAGEGKAMGTLVTDIGEYLSNLGQTRATQALNQEQIANQLATGMGQFGLQSRLNISPEDTYGKYLNTDVNQSNMQVQADYERSVQQAQQDYQNALNKAAQKAALYRTIGMIAPGAGAIYGGTQGGSAGFTASMQGTMDTAKLAASFMGGGGGGGNTMPTFQESVALANQYNQPSYGSAQPVNSYSNPYQSSLSSNQWSMGLK